MHGFSRNNSTPDIGCLYPRYGKDCQMTCRCEEMFCNTRNGCIGIITIKMINNLAVINLILNFRGSHFSFNRYQFYI